MTDSTPTTITDVHCQSCGSTSLENVGYEALRAGDGYTACCNERAIYPTTTDLYTGRPVAAKCDPTDCYHH